MQLKKFLYFPHSEIIISLMTLMAGTAERSAHLYRNIAVHNAR